MHDTAHHNDSRQQGWRTARRRAAVVAGLIVVVPLIWVAFGLQLTTVVQIAIAVLGLLTLAIACAWMALAVPGRRRDGEPSLN
ncbi:MAG: hypothetical protein JJT93_13815 [Gammaproteobacteria bacterium]|nr:hypothetical protein [Gammaproteobacteria bacterium]TVQ46853.1 MAG: hypothetical protein EA371_09395 [Gammaproteobacteria bacterium]